MTGTLSSRTWKQIYGLIGELESVRSRSELLGGFAEEIQKLIPYDTAHGGLIDPTTWQFKNEPFSARGISNYQSIVNIYMSHYVKLDPLRRRTLNVRFANIPVSHSDFFSSKKRFKNSEFYWDFLKSVANVDSGLGCLWVADRIPQAAFALHRETGTREFSIRERAIYQTLAPRLAYMMQMLSEVETIRAIGKTSDEQSGIGLEMLTPRQLEITSYVTRGDSNKEVAKSCNISEQTVKDHLKSIYKKLQVTSRAKLTSKIYTLR